MDASRYIDSLKNSLVKEVILIKEKSRWRKKSGRFVVEGQRELAMALKGGFTLEKVFFFSEIITPEELDSLLNTYQCRAERIEVSKEVYRRMAYREKTEGLLAVGVAKEHGLPELNIRSEKPLILIAESIEKPGNIGALLRTADAAALDAVIIANPLTDLYNPNIIRSSLGCVFTVPIAMAGNQEVMNYLESRNINTYAAELKAEELYTEMDFSEASAIVVGPESTGLTEEWLKFSTRRVIIPMQGQIDSMNVSVSAAILIFEAMRQRKFDI